MGNGFLPALLLVIGTCIQALALPNVVCGQALQLDQGWNDEQRETFYFTAQGSQLIPYDWFLFLEQAESNRLFRDDENIRKYGFLPSKPSTLNPDGLPIGFVRDGVNPAAMEAVHLEASQSAVVAAATRFGIKKAYLGATFDEKLYPNEQKAWFGLTCAACHTHELVFGDKTIRIDGGSSQADIESLLRDLGLALQATTEDDNKLRRFAEAVGNNRANLEEFRKEVMQISDAVNRLVARNTADHPYGYARLDAFGAILNAVCETALNIPENHRQSSAPVSYPSLWNTPRLSFVQWNASAANAEGRNVGEVLGVFGTYTLEPGPTQFDSTVRLTNLVMIEHELVDKLRSPTWPEDLLGKLDRQKIELGKALFQKNCVSCHAIRNPDGNFELNSAKKIPVGSSLLSDIKTDPQFFINLNPKILVQTGELSALFENKTHVTRPEMLAGVVKGIIINRAKAERVDLSQLQVPVQDPPLPGGSGTGYISRPLEGIWATAPYFHNGSVPNLYETLLPMADRSKSFQVGTRNFDPIKVGFIPSPSNLGNTFSVFDKDGLPIPGNSNSGHEGHGLKENEGFTQTFENGAWRDFTEAERWALVEYMKSLSPPPASAVESGAPAPQATPSLSASESGSSPVNTFEAIPDDEAEQIKNTVDLTLKRMQLQYKNTDLAKRGVHPKDHGCVVAQFEVHADLPDEYNVGIFQKGRSYDAFIRFSNADVEIGSDSKEGPPGKIRHGSRGMAIKLLGVDGDSLLPLHGALTQDLVMINQPAFAFANVEDYELLSRVLVEHFGEPDAAKHFFVQRFTQGTPAQQLRAKRTQQIVTRISASEVNGETGAFFPPPASPIDNPYFSAAPFAFGKDRVMKFRVTPQNPSLDKPKVDDPNYLRTALVERLNDNAVTFDFEIQVRTASQVNIENDIENASMEWNDPYIKVATLTIPAQEFDSAEQREKCERLFFTPWHGIKAHQPLGGINRLRKAVYIGSAAHRNLPKEPASL